MHKPVDVIVTQRLQLRSARASDLAVLHERVFSDPAVMQHAFAGRPFSLDEAAAFFENNFDHEGTGRKLGVLAERASSEVIGFAGLLPCTILNEPDYELGFVLCRLRWGFGYATEIGLGQLRYGFTEAGCDRLLAQVSPKNTASIVALKKIGMKFHSTVWSEERGRREVYVAYNRADATD